MIHESSDNEHTMELLGMPPVWYVCHKWIIIYGEEVPEFYRHIAPPICPGSHGRVPRRTKEAMLVDRGSEAEWTLAEVVETRLYVRIFRGSPIYAIRTSVFSAEGRWCLASSKVPFLKIGDLLGLSAFVHELLLVENRVVRDLFSMVWAHGLRGSISWTN